MLSGITCSNVTIEILEKGVESVKSLSKLGILFGLIFYKKNLCIKVNHVPIVSYISVPFISFFVLTSYHYEPKPI